MTDCRVTDVPRNDNEGISKMKSLMFFCNKMFIYYLHNNEFLLTLLWYC